MLKWATQHKLTFVTMGGNTLDFNCPNVGIYLKDLLESSLMELFNRGHRRIITLFPNVRPELQQQYNSKISKLYTKHHHVFSPRFHFPTWSGHSAAEFTEQLEQSFKISPPTALIVPDENCLCLVTAFCMQRGIKIPEDLSVVCCTAGENTEWFLPAPAYFSVDPKKFAKKISLLIENYTQNSNTKIKMIPDFTLGNSIADVVQ